MHFEISGQLVTNLDQLASKGSENLQKTDDHTAEK